MPKRRRPFFRHPARIEAETYWFDVPPAAFRLRSGRCVETKSCDFTTTLCARARIMSRVRAELLPDRVGAVERVVLGQFAIGCVRRNVTLFPSPKRSTHRVTFGFLSIAA